jgi:hypothetical protein
LTRSGRTGEREGEEERKDGDDREMSRRRRGKRED